MANDWCDGFLQLVKSAKPIQGECTDIDYPKSIEILSFKVGSMSGFADTDEFYAVQTVGDRHGVAMTRAYQNDESEGLSSLFASDEEIDQFQGQDLSKVEACKFTIVKEMDISSPDLFRAYCSAQDLDHRDVFDSATVTLRKATGKTREAFLTYTFNDVVVVGYSLEIGGDASPKETIGLSFGKVRVEFRPQKITGEMGLVIKGGWDFIERTSL